MNLYADDKTINLLHIQHEYVKLVQTLLAGTLVFTPPPQVTYKCQPCKVKRRDLCVFVCLCVRLWTCVCAGVSDQSDFSVSFPVCSCSHDVNTASDEWRQRDGQERLEPVSHTDGWTD